MMAQDSRQAACEIATDVLVSGACLSSVGLLQAQDADLAARLLLLLASLLDPSSTAAAGLSPESASRLDELATTLAGVHWPAKSSHARHPR